MSDSSSVALLTRPCRDQPRFTALQSTEVAVDWQEPMVLERNAAATTHTTAPYRTAPVT